MNDSSGREKEALDGAFAPSVLLESLPVGVYYCRRDGTIKHYNRRATELWGHTPLVGDSDERFCGAHKLFLPDGSVLTHDKTPMADVLRTHKAVRDLHVIIEQPNGIRVDAMVNVEPLFDERRSFIGAVSCFQDVTEMVRVHQEVQGSGGDLDDFFENGAVGLHIVGGDGRILRANRAELELLGYTESEYVGRHIAEFHADAHIIEDILRRLSRGEQLKKYPARLRAKDGSIRQVLITSNACIRNGRFVQTRCFTLDVTEATRAEERAQEGERRFQDVLEGMPVAVYTTDAEGTLTYSNPAAAEMAGRTLRAGVDKWCIFERFYTTDDVLLPFDLYPTVQAVREKRPVEGAEFIGERPDGSHVRCMAYPRPLFDGNGNIAGAVNIMLDISDLHRAEVEAAHLAAIVSSSSDAIVSKSLDGTIRSWNAGAARIFGYEPDEIIGRPITCIIPPELHKQEAEILSRLQHGERIEHFETVRIAKSGQRLDISLTVSPVYDKSGRIVGASKVARDVTERKRAERLQRLLISELNHRVKNTLATVQSIANQTVRISRSPAEFAASFSGRIQALAHTHDLLTRNSWQGADILALIGDELLLRGVEDKRISFSGPSITLDPPQALHVALILHELGTNARKYGSLSVPDGRLVVSWTVRSGNKGSHLLLQWQESGGPAVEVPTTRGFGTTLIEKSLAAHGGEASIDYRAEGVSSEIILPIDDRTRPDEYDLLSPIQATTSSPSGQESVSVTSIQGTRVLVVEDEALIAMDIASILSEAGCIVIGPVATLDEAGKHVAQGGFDVALLDANLDGQPVDELAAALTRIDVPFAFLTGYEREALPLAFREAPLVSKPFTSNEAIEIVARLVAKDPSVIHLHQKKS